MRSLKMMDGCKGTQVYALNPSGETTTNGFGGGGGVGEKFLQNLLSNSVRSRSNHDFRAIQSKDEVNSAVWPKPLPDGGCAESLASQGCILSNVHIWGLPDPKLFRKCLMSARLQAVDVHTKVVLSAWLRFERREDELIGVSAMDCCGRSMECPGSALVAGYNPESATDPCHLKSCCMVALWTREGKIIFQNGISAKGMKAAEMFSRTKRVDSFNPDIVLELLSLANKFCCDEMKSVCDTYLASLVFDMDTAMLLLEYRLGECISSGGSMFAGIFKGTSNSMHNPNVSRLFYSSEGCVMLERKEYKDAQKWFEAAVEAGHVYSLVGIARSKYKRGHMYKAYKLMNSFISDYTPSGWMYQERSMYCQGKEKMMDLSTATELDPTLSYPVQVETVSDGRKIDLDQLYLRLTKYLALGFLLTALSFCLVLITLEDYEGALRDADCWMQLYDRWSSVDDIGSLAVVHHMLANDQGKSLLRGSGNLSCFYEAIAKAEESISIQRSFEAFFLKAYVLSETTPDSESSLYSIQLLEEALRCPSDGLRKGQALSNLASVYVDVDKLDNAIDCYTNALNIKHTSPSGSQRVYHLKRSEKISL
ncbi:hypothetical protein HAX54_024972 [Datura stramonium]|uniref:Uncharacterized protein n=1 Tax=Datura stramonium TaxID=4076 RepID=A0ABS8S5S8_DATST|nr:hypothetical protein [Datura stramonium]